MMLKFSNKAYLIAIALSGKLNVAVAVDYTPSIEITKSIKMPASSKDIPDMVAGKVRRFMSKGNVRPHYRNLRNERYYRGQWQEWAPGSR